MGMFTHLVIIQHVAFALLLGFALVALVCLAYLSGRGEHNHYDGQGIGPFEHYGNWVREGQGPVPLFLKVWIVFIVGCAITMTGIVIHHGFRY